MSSPDPGRGSGDGNNPAKNAEEAYRAAVPPDILEQATIAKARRLGLLPQEEPDSGSMEADSGSMEADSGSMQSEAGDSYTSSLVTKASRSSSAQEGQEPVEGGVETSLPGYESDSDSMQSEAGDSFTSSLVTEGNRTNSDIAPDPAEQGPTPAQEVQAQYLESIRARRREAQERQESRSRSPSPSRGDQDFER